MDYKDYYQILGVSKSATKAEIKKAYKRLAGKLHPDVSKETNAEERFKEVNEAYEVLKSDENRASYDQLGANWKAGQQGGFGGQGGPGGFGGADFGDFFNSVFGGGGQAGGFGGQQSFQRKGESIKQTIQVPLSDLYTGVNRVFNVKQPERHPSGQTYLVEKRLTIKIPKGIEPGKSIRLKGKGQPGQGGGASGDLLLKVELAEDNIYELKGTDVYVDLKLMPWEAALGAKVTVKTPTGPMALNIPKNMQAGKKMRLKGKGLPTQVPGNLYVKIIIVNPPEDDELTEMWQQMAELSNYNPRD